MLCEEYRVIVPDLPGHGESPRLAPGSALPDFADALATFCDGVGVGTAALAGSGFGALVALELAIASPGRVACLALAHATPAFDRAEYDEVLRAHERALGERCAYVQKRGTRALGARLARELGDSFLGEALLATYEALATEGFVAAVEARQVRPDRTEELASLAMPMLLCTGEDDPQRSAAELMASRIPGARVVEFADGGACLPALRPAAFAEALYDFLRDVEDGVAVAGRRRL
jgi:pimeloyl-ACP methyl ester carboxylesterase